MKESLDDTKVDNLEARRIYNRIMRAHVKMVDTIGKGVVEPFTPELYDDEGRKPKI